MFAVPADRTAAFPDQPDALARILDRDLDLIRCRARPLHNADEPSAVILAAQAKHGATQKIPPALLYLTGQTTADIGLAERRLCGFRERSGQEHPDADISGYSGESASRRGSCQGHTSALTRRGAAPHGSPAALTLAESAGGSDGPGSNGTQLRDGTGRGQRRRAGAADPEPA